MQMFTYREVMQAASFWYGDTDINSMCLAENRLNRGETIKKKEENDDYQTENDLPSGPEE